MTQSVLSLATATLVATDEFFVRSGGDIKVAELEAVRDFITGTFADLPWFVVTPWDSFRVDKADPTYLCDGSADQTEFNNAQTAASALTNGGIVYVAPGTLNFASAGQLKSNVITILDRGAEIKVMGSMTAVLTFGTSVTRAAIVGKGTINGNKASYSTSGSTGLVNFSSTSSNCRLDGPHIKDSGGRGVWVAGTDNTVENVLIEGCSFQALEGNGTRVTVRDSEMKLCGTLNTSTGASHTGIKLSGDDGRVHRNYIHDIEGKGIEVIGDDNAPTFTPSLMSFINGVVVMGNHVEMVTEVGIHINTVRRARVVGNTSINNMNNGIDFNNVTGGNISDNDCHFNGSPRAPTVSTQEGSGIFLFKCQDITVDDNRCESNSQGQLTGDPRAGIRMSSGNATADYRPMSGITFGSNVCVERRTDNAFTVTNTEDIDATQTSIQFGSLTGTIPLDGGNITLENKLADGGPGGTAGTGEVIVVTSKPTAVGTWTVVRGRSTAVNNTVGASHLAGSKWTMRASQQYGFMAKYIGSGGAINIERILPPVRSILWPNRTAAVLASDYSGVFTVSAAENLTT